MRVLPFERLETRRLLALTLLGPDAPVAESAPPVDFEVAVAGDGSYLVATVRADVDQPGEPIVQSVWAVRFGATAQQLGQPIMLASGEQYGVSASMDADGDAVVAWVEYASDASTVYFSRISKTGVVAPPVPVAQADDPLEFHVSEPAVSMDAGGGFFIGWTQQIEGETVDSAKVRAYDAVGAPRGPAFTAMTASPVVFLGGLDLASNPDGSGAVFAAVISHDNGSDGVFGRVSTTAAVGELGGLEGVGNESAPDVAVHPDGSFDIAYHHYTTLFAGGPYSTLGVSVQRFDAGGVERGEAIELLPLSNAGPDEFGIPPSIDALPDGGFVAAFVESHEDNTGTLFLHRVNASGVQDADGPLTIQVESDPNGSVPIQYRAEVGADAGGNAVLTYVKDATNPPVLHLRLATSSEPFVQDGALYVSGTSAGDAIQIQLQGSNVVVTRGTEMDTFAAATVNVLIVDGLGGEDTITNDTSLTATLRGGDGDDTIYGGSGIDRLHGGIGRDSLWGRDGADRLYGEDGVDSLYGNGGNDRLEGGAQGDHMRGNGGRDMMFGNGGHDRMYGGASGDRMYGQAGNDRIFGEGGNDRLYGDDGFIDSLYGGAGDDVFITLDGVIDHLFGDGGDDSANADEEDVLTSIKERT